MSRPGTGGGSRGGSSGGHSSSRSSGGHHVGSGSRSSRPGTSRSSYGGSSGYHRSNYGSNYGSSYRGGYGNSYHHYGPTYVGGGGYPRRQRIPSSIILAIIIFVILLGVFSGIGSSDAPKSTINRTKIDNPVAYTNACIMDELGYVESPAALSKDLQYFYKKTGIQPYIVLKKYDANLNTDAKKEEYSRKYYEEHIKNEGTFLYMYFEEPNADDVGYMTYVNGKQVTSVMDEEAVNIFWSYIDRYWVDGNLTMNQVFEKSFNKTADTIMDKSTTGMDVMKYVVIGIIVLGGCAALVVIRKQKRQHAAEEAAETERILNTPVGKTQADDLADKYN